MSIRRNWDNIKFNEAEMAEQQMLQFELVRPIPEHAHLIMQWRNDPVTLKMSYHGEPKVWNTFFQEFQQEYFCFPDLPPLFVLSRGQRAAFLRFRPAEDPLKRGRRCCEISINVAPEFRGQGIGERSLMETKDWIRQQGYDDLYAEVRPENIPSQKVFEHAGYTRLPEVQKILDEKGTSISIYRYLAELTQVEPDPGSRVFIIAEAGSNWRMGTPPRDLAMAKTLITVAAEAGADAIKFQVFRPSTVYAPNAGAADYLAEAGVKEDISTIFTDLAMPYEMLKELDEYCQKTGVEFMATAFSKTDFAEVDPYVRVHKIASYEINHLRLIEAAAASRKPVLISTAAASADEIDWAVTTFRTLGGHDLTLLQCTAKYPARPESMQLNAIPWLRQRFKAKVGLSDHSRHPIHAPVAAVALGASVIEKHFTIDNRLPGPDHPFAVTPEELRQMVQAIRATEQMLGPHVKAIHEDENELRLFAKRGIQAIRNISAGDIFHEGKNIDILRPGKQPLGIHPRHIVEIEGKPAKRTIPTGQGIRFDDF